MTRDQIKAEIQTQLEVPRLIVKNKDYERSEHFGQIRVDVFGEVEIDQECSYYMVIDYLFPEDLHFALKELFETAMYIRDPDLQFNIEIAPYILFMQYKDNTLEVCYKWQET